MKAVTVNFSIGREMWDGFKSKLLGKGHRFNGLSLNLEEVPEPKLVSPEWVKIRTILSGISDMDEGMIVHQDPSRFGAFLSFPFVPGNENLGIVTEVGDNVRGIEPGERVVVDPLLSCERRGVEPLCPSCSRGTPSSCRSFDAGLLGPGVMIGACRDTSGGWGDSFIAHRSQVRVVPNSMESEQAILIPEFTRALRAVLQSPPSPGDRVLIVGAGSLGLLTLEALTLVGSEAQISITAEHSFEAELAEKLGASQVVWGHGPGTVYEEVAAILDATVRYPEVGKITLRGGADLVYETTGRTAMIEDAMGFTGEGKRLVLLGINQPAGFDVSGLWFKDIKLTGSSFSGRESFNGEISGTFDIAMDLAARHGLPHKEILTHRFGLADHAAAVSVLADRANRKAVKAVFHHVV
jgi:threonine dehydrogenase-like Zn-dependent dehydrogenase